MKKEIGVDFGSAMFRACVPGAGPVNCEPAMVAVERTTGNTVKFGRAAQRLVEDSAGAFFPRFPFSAGVFSDCPLAERVLSWCRTQNFPMGEEVRALFAIPCGFSGEEEGAFTELAARAGFRDAYMVYSPVAALVGGGCSMEESYLGVDIGCYTTDVVLVSNGELLQRFCIDKAGYAFTEALAKYVREKSRLSINFRMAEQLKRQIGTVWVEGERRQMEIVGRASDGSMRSTVVSSDEMFAALEEPCAAILEVVCEAISKTPAEAVRETFEHGIRLSGGGAMLEGMDRMIEGVTGVRCVRTPDAENVVLRGLERILARLPEQIHTGRNVSAIAVKTSSYID